MKNESLEQAYTLKFNPMGCSIQMSAVRLDQISEFENNNEITAIPNKRRFNAEPYSNYIPAYL